MLEIDNMFLSDKGRDTRYKALLQAPVETHKALLQALVET